MKKPNQRQDSRKTPSMLKATNVDNDKEKDGDNNQNVRASESTSSSQLDSSAKENVKRGNRNVNHKMKNKRNVANADGETYGKKTSKGNFDRSSVRRSSHSKSRGENQERNSRKNGEKNGHIPMESSNKSSFDRSFRSRREDYKKNSQCKSEKKGKNEVNTDKSSFKRSSHSRSKRDHQRRDSRDIDERKEIISTESMDCTESKKDQQRHRSSRTKKINYEPHLQLDEVLKQYHAKDNLHKDLGRIIRGKLRTQPGGAFAFVACDRGSLKKDVLLKGEIDRNRAMNGDIVFVKIVGIANDDDNGTESQQNLSLHGSGSHQSHDKEKELTIDEAMQFLQLRGKGESSKSDFDDKIHNTELDFDGVVEQGNDSEKSQNILYDDDPGSGSEMEYETDSEDEMQELLWNPIIDRCKKKNHKSKKPEDTLGNNSGDKVVQFSGHVVHVVVPKMDFQTSEIHPEHRDKRKKKKNNKSQNESTVPRRTVVGTLKKLAPNGDRYLLVPNNRCMPRFITPTNTHSIVGKNGSIENSDGNCGLYKAEYIYNTWSEICKWPPVVNLTALGTTCNAEDETEALMLEYGVETGDFPADVLKDVDNAVSSGRFRQEHDGEWGWKPTPEMCEGRRDYRTNRRVFTIDPTTARDLDDALHIHPLPDGKVEVGVHIADVSHFVQHQSAVDREALRRATTVYLVDRVVPMLPRPLCEIACSLNENVERLAFSCVWVMNKDGTMATRNDKNKKKSKEKNLDVWFGRTVIKSCARLDYATAQNIIEKKVAIPGCNERELDENLWPQSRRPTGEHSIEDVAFDVRLLHQVAMARRALRFKNGALALNGVKLTFKLKDDGSSPELCQPYPIRDSNRLVEEYMLLANFLVAQRLIEILPDVALIRCHPPPLSDGIDGVVQIAQESVGFCIDSSSSSSLQASLSRMGREVRDDLVIQCVTEMLMNPMRPAEYIAAGEVASSNETGNSDVQGWRHFALNIPYYTHFTSPIRRYPDIVVHRLLQCTIETSQNCNDVDNIGFPLDTKDVSNISGHCNERRMDAKKAQERSDRIFLSLYLLLNPISKALGVVLSVGEKAFTVFIPSLGVTTMAYIDDHKDSFDVSTHGDKKGKRSMVFSAKNSRTKGVMKLDIKVFSKITVSCTCKEKPPIDVSINVVGPWNE